MSKKIICIGAANVDTKLYLKDSAQMNTSNPCTTTKCVGGVARNVGDNLARLNLECELLVVHGNDFEWDFIKNESHQNLNMTSSIAIPNKNTSKYMAVLEPSGNLLMGLADMEIVNEFTPKLLDDKKTLLLESELIVVDLNLSQDSITYLFDFVKKHNKKLIVIGVSGPKMKNLPQNLKNVEWLIVNVDETEAFFNTKITNEQEWKSSLEKWTKLGVKNIIITNGTNGVMFLNESNKTIYLPITPAKKVIDATGAGDAFCAGVIYGIFKNFSNEKILKTGLFIASQTVQVKETVWQELCEEKILKEIKE